MSNFNVHISFNQKKNYFFVTIKRPNGDIFHEYLHEVTAFTPEFHQKLIAKECQLLINLWE